MLDVISIIKEYSYIGIFIIVFLECGIFFLLPGDSLLFAVGIMASRGFLSFYPAVFFIVCAAILGGKAGYFIGKYFEHIFEHKHFKKIFPKNKLDHVRDFFKKNGDKTILFCRFVPIVRTFAPIVAGFSEMRFSTFWKYNVLGGILWGMLIPTLGYLFGNTFPALEHNIGLISILIVVVSVLPFGVKYVANKKVKS